MKRDGSGFHPPENGNFYELTDSGIKQMNEYGVYTSIGMLAVPRGYMNQIKENMNAIANQKTRIMMFLCRLLIYDPLTFSELFDKIQEGTMLLSKEDIDTLKNNTEQYIAEALKAKFIERVQERRRINYADW